MNHKLKLLAIALTGLVGASSAQAMTFDMGVVSAPDTFSAAIGVNGIFSDKWIFDVPATTWAGGSVSDLSLNTVIGQSMVSLFNIDGLSVQLFDSNDNLISDLDTNPFSSMDYKAGSGTLSAGNDYYFMISGNGNGMLGGQYVFAVTTLPVPEPETWAMLVAGLGLVGLQLRRRSNAGHISIN